MVRGPEPNARGVVVASEEVAAALADRRPVVALESTIIAHGFPAPERRPVADALESAVRRAGAVPATVAIVRGVLRAGLSASDLDCLTDDSEPVAKAAALDVAVHMADKTTAATTVSATVLAAARLGIRVFATGGIGGVHRGGLGDVSSDLGAIAAHPVAVVSAGAKAILDLPRTLEALETLGVLVIGYQCGELPAFYCRSSGLPLAHRIDDVAQLAAVAHGRFERLAQGGLLVCQPIDEEHALDSDEISSAIALALEDAERKGVSGKAVTPFLLAEVAKRSGGRAVSANRALAVGNAELGARLAIAYAELVAARASSGDAPPV